MCHEGMGILVFIHQRAFSPAKKNPIKYAHTDPPETRATFLFLAQLRERKPRNKKRGSEENDSLWVLGFFLFNCHRWRRLFMFLSCWKPPTLGLASTTNLLFTEAKFQMIFHREVSTTSPLTVTNTSALPQTKENIRFLNLLWQQIQFVFPSIKTKLVSSFMDLLLRHRTEAWFCSWACG